MRRGAYGRGRAGWGPGFRLSNDPRPAPASGPRRRAWRPGRAAARATSFQIAEPAAGLGQLVEQGRHGEVIAEPGLEVVHPLGDHGRPNQVRPEHRPAAIDRPAVAVDPDDIDVRGAKRDAFLQDLRPLVDHRIEAAL